DGRVVQGLLPRLWFRHFAGTSWIAEARSDRAESGEARLAGFVVGFRSPGHADLAVLQAVGVDPNLRRRGIGRRLVEHFLADAQASLAASVEATTWPGNRRALTFLEALGFAPDVASSPRRVYGVPAIEDYDFGTEDRARLLRRL
ncbi:MAG: GNAT family N-acetyltransferase, partial [Chloroflexota bacterium]